MGKGTYKQLPAARGVLSLAVTNARLIGSFDRCDTIAGAVDVRKRRVLTFSWTATR
jgi:hypothetical protein